MVYVSVNGLVFLNGYKSIRNFSGNEIWLHWVWTLFISCPGVNVSMDLFSHGGSYRTQSLSLQPINPVTPATNVFFFFSSLNWNQLSLFWHSVESPWLCLYLSINRDFSLLRLNCSESTIGKLNARRTRIPVFFRCLRLASHPHHYSFRHLPFSDLFS